MDRTIDSRWGINFACGVVKLGHSGNPVVTIGQLQLIYEVKDRETW